MTPPYHAGTPCVEAGCFNLATAKGRCAQCLLIHGGGRAPYDRQRGGARERGYDRKWEKRRKRWLEAEPFCRECGKPGKEVDHVIPHRSARWLFDLKGNLQTLCKVHHTKKTMAERTMAIEMMYPLDLPEPPHARPTRLLCGPNVETPQLGEGTQEQIAIYGDNPNHYHRNISLAGALAQETEIPLILQIAAPRTAERAFWSHVMGCEAELWDPPPEVILDQSPVAWWDEYNLDRCAEEAMARRLS